MSYVKKGRLAAAGLAAALLALSGAASASADVAAHFSPVSTTIKQTGDITIKQGPAGQGGTWSCPSWSMTGQVSSDGSNWMQAGLQRQNCTNTATGQAGTFPTWTLEFPRRDGSNYSVRVTPGSVFTMPALSVSYRGLVPYYSVPFINGSAGTPSRLVYNNIAIGENYYMTGELSVTTLSGGLVTATP